MTDILRAEYGYNLQILCVFYEICTNLICITHFWHLFVYLDTSSLREKGQLSTQLFFGAGVCFWTTFLVKTKIHRLIFTSGRGSMSMPGSRAGSPTGCGSGTPISSTGSAARPTRQSQGPFPRGTGGFRRVVLQQHSLGKNDLFFNYGFLRANCEINKFKRPEVGIYKRKQEIKNST